MAAFRSSLCTRSEKGAYPFSRQIHKIPKTSCTPGFTLIETLIITGILSLLLSIAIPKYYDFKIRANDATALADARNAINLIASSKGR